MTDRENPALLCPPSEKDALETRNGVALARFVANFFAESEGRSPYLSVVLRKMHHLTIQDIYRCAGSFRTQAFDEKIVLTGASFKPRPAYEVLMDVPDLLTQACGWRQHPDLVTDVFARAQFAAACFHQLVSIHPFAGGNGRVCRAFLHLMLYEMKVLTPPDQLFDYFAYRKPESLDALKAADRGDPEPLQEFIARGVLDCNWQNLCDVIRLPDLTSFVEQMSDEDRRNMDRRERAKLTDEEFRASLVGFIRRTADGLRTVVGSSSGDPTTQDEDSYRKE